MSETKIQVPSEMLDAALPCYLPDRSLVRSILESALRWLSENPIVPNEADVMEILQERVRSHHISGEEYCAIPPATVRFVIREWQRRMFLAEEAFDPSLGGVLSGRTFTREQFDAIKEYLEGAVHG